MWDVADDDDDNNAKFMCYLTDSCLTHFIYKHAYFLGTTSWKSLSLSFFYSSLKLRHCLHLSVVKTRSHGHRHMNNNYWYFNSPIENGT